MNTQEDGVTATNREIAEKIGVESSRRKFLTDHDYQEWIADQIERALDEKDVYAREAEERKRWAESVQDDLKAKDAALAEARAEIERLKEAHAGSIALYLKLESERDALEQQVRALREELEKRKGCDHLDAPYRRLLKENEALKARAAIDPEKLAEKFHDHYERLAPYYGYSTRTETRVFNPQTPNGHLMIAVCRELVKELNAPVEGEGEGKI